MYTKDELRNNESYQRGFAVYLLTSILNLNPTLAHRIVDHFGTISRLARASDAELEQIHGVGTKTAQKIMGLTAWALLLEASAITQKQQIRTPNDLAQMVILEMSLLETEELRIALLNTKSRVTAIRTVYQGNLNTMLVRISEIFRPAVHANSASIVLIHNHPSGDPTPSHEDVHVTKLAYEMGLQLDIEVLDHLIIAGNEYVSLRERGLGF